MKYLLYIFTIVITLSSCSEPIVLDLPDSDQKVVVEGVIESGEAPYVILTKSLPYYTEIDTNTLADLIITDADLVTVKNNSTGVIDTLTVKFNFNSYPYVYYEASNPKFYGEEGGSYDLKVVVDTVTLTSTTTIPEIIPLDSVWFEIEGNLDTLGVAYGHLTDPPALGNYYRWYTKRKNKDTRFVAPLGSVTDDKFYNAESFDFFYYREPDPFGETEDDFSQYYFKVGDTVIVKFASLDYNTFNFWKTMETDAGSEGNPFAAPVSTVSNIEGGGLGVWGGYGVALDTFICEID